jgi:hypothetical protein
MRIASQSYVLINFGFGGRSQLFTLKLLSNREAEKVRNSPL